jgi:hypothetical protein
MNELPSHLTKAQLELLKMFSRDIPDEQWEEIRQLISRYFMQKVVEIADKVTADWTQEDFDRLLHTHLRTPYNPTN